MVKGMSAGVLVSLSEYLETDYSPDREFVDGAVVERHLGELPHSFVQRNLVLALSLHYPNCFAMPELRVRTVGGRCRTPDVCLTLDRPETDVLEAPPFLVVEILSPRGEMTGVLEKLEEYAAFGVANIWVVDPRRKRVYKFGGNCLEEVAETFVATHAGEVRLEIGEIFLGL